jgi:N4-gp56 family major capsid protein
MASAITGATANILTTSATYGGTNSQLSQAIQTIWSKEILFQAMPILRFEQFAVKKTELGVQPGLTVNFMRYDNLGAASQLTEGVRMQTNALTASQFSITVAEQGFAVAVSELLLNASFDDIMASASRLLGRNMALYLDQSARDTLLLSPSTTYGTSTPLTGGTIYGRKPPSGAITPVSPYDLGTKAFTRNQLDGTFFFGLDAVKDSVETLASANIPRLGETYVCFVDPHQARNLRDNPEWVEVTKYAGPGNFMLGEIGRLFDTVFIETTQVKQIANTEATPQPVHQAVMIGDNAFGHAIALPVELRDGGVLDFGREHALAWYAIWGFGLITPNAVNVIETN